MNFFELKKQAELDGMDIKTETKKADIIAFYGEAGLPTEAIETEKKPVAKSAEKKPVEQEIELPEGALVTFESEKSIQYKIGKKKFIKIK